MASIPPGTVEPVGPTASDPEDDMARTESRLLGSPAVPAMPYPGLRAFRAEEMAIFFGREAALDAMLDRLAETKFLAVLGPSGCGKSSLVRSGLYSALELGLLPRAGGRWRIAEFHPGREPMRNLARALVHATGRADPDGGLSEADMVELVAAHLQRGPRSIVELVEGGLLGEGEGWNLLVVVDQFEELFHDEAGREIAEATAELLLESVRSPLPIHVVLTMRSEYLGACSLITGLAEQISAGMYLTPRMTRAESRDAILGPASVLGFDVEPELVARILIQLHGFAGADPDEDLEEARRLSLQADQLPLMQHVLNLMWHWAGRRQHSSAGRLTLRLSDYEQAGGLEGALDAHGDEIIASLAAQPGQDVRTTVERVFRELVDGPSLALAVRRPRSIAQLVEAVGGEARRGEVMRIVDVFRSPDCNFLRPYEGRNLHDDVVVDISHEILIRRWSLLSAWFEAESEAAAMWRRLTQEVELWRENRSCLLRGLPLWRFSEWWSRERPFPTIAARYGGDFEAAIHFIEESKAAERRAKRRRRVGIALAAAALFLIAGLTGAWLSLARQNEELRAAHALAVQHERRAEQALSRERELASKNTVTALALSDYFGRRQCRQHPAGSAEYRRCVAARIRMLYDEYRATRLSPDRELPGAVGRPAE